MLKRKSKRFLSIVLAAAMIVGLFPVAAFAEDGTATDNVVASATISGTTTTYDTFEGAVKAVFESKDKTGTVNLLQDASGSGIVFPSGVNITIDLGGNTYDVSRSTVGSSDTETNGFQLLKDSTIVFQNGTLTVSSSSAQILIQNYSNLTLNNVHLDGTNNNNNISYVLSNNNGKTNIIGNTSITAKKGKTAFDVYNWPSNGYKDGAQVVVNTTGTIAGKIEVTKDDSTGESASTLDIKNITHVGDLSIQDGLTEKCQITGGTFTDKEDVQKCLAPGNTLDENGNVVVDSATAEAEINGFGYATLEEALAEAKNGDVVNVVNDVEVDTQIAPNAGVTINGNGHSVTYTGTTENISGGAFNITNDNVTITDLTINAGDLKHGVQFYCTEGGELNGVTINGGVYTSVIVNGATNVDIIDCVLNPADGAYTNIEYAMGSNVTTIPSMTINNVTFDDSTRAVYADGNTTDRIETAMDGNQTNDEILDKILDSITYTNPNGGSLPISVLFSDGTSEVIREESTYQPPYTGKYSYEIFTKVGDNGAIDVDRYATEGDKVTITVSPDEAYMLDEMTLTSGGKDVEVTDNGDGTYTFTMPSGDVKIEVTFAEDPDWEEEPAMPFVDVDENDWFYDVVLYAYENGLMTGTSADTFAPNTATTRGMIVSMLARLEGVTNAESAGFTDVAESDWYATAVNWAASEGIVNGFEDDTFRPNAAITREQMAAILYNYADYKGYDVSARADLSDYADAASISSWAEDVLAWANAEGLINGMTATTIDPQGATTRAQTAAMFERFLTAHEA